MDNNKILIAKDDVDGEIVISDDIFVSQWISVKERLPRNYIEVLVFDAIDREMFLGAIGSSGEWEVPGYRTEMFNVTHWMPLPKPPKEKMR